MYTGSTIPDLKNLRLVIRCKRINSYDIVWWALCGRSMCVIEAHWRDVWPRFYWSIKRRYVSHKTLWMNWHQNRCKKMNWPHTHTHTKFNSIPRRKMSWRNIQRVEYAWRFQKGWKFFNMAGAESMNMDKRKHKLERKVGAATKATLRNWNM